MSTLRSIIQYPASRIKKPYTVPVLDGNSRLPSGIGMHDAIIGDDSNNLSVAPDGTITLNGTARVYDGHYLDASNFKLPSADAATEVNRGMGTAYEFADGVLNELHCQFRIPGKWLDTEDIYSCLFWDSPTISADCDWKVSYLLRAADEDMTVAAADGTLQSYETSSPTANGLVRSHVTIPTTSFDVGDKVIVLKITRDGGDASDTLGASAFLHGIMMKGIVNKLGGAI